MKRDTKNAVLGGVCAGMAKQMDMAFDEYCSFQNLKSIASTTGRLTLEEAMTIYGYLGNTPEHFNAQPLAVKYCLTNVFSSLLGDRIKERSHA